jgi:uncharacterized protein (UPF0332 family)
LEASQILLENQKPIEAASRAYYAAYQMVTGVLVKLKLSPRSEFGNWSHQETQTMYHTLICKKASLGAKERVALTKLRLGFRNLFITRHKADYGIDVDVNMLLAQALWREANQLIKLLEKLAERGLL